MGNKCRRAKIKPFSREPFEATRQTIDGTACPRTRVICLSETHRMKETTELLGTTVTMSAALLPINLPKSEVKAYVKKLAWNFDLRLGDLILVYKPHDGDSNSLAEAFSVVRVLR